MKKLFGWLKKLITLSLVAIIAWIIYANRDQMALPNGTSAVVEGDKAAGQTEQDAPVAAPSELQQASAPALEATEAPAKIEPPVAVEPPSVEETAETPEPPTAVETPVEGEIPVVVEMPAAEKAAEVEAPATTEQPASEPPVDTEAQTAAPAEENSNSPLDDARKAALTGEMDKAESAYRQLQKEQPDNYDAYGELGNLYLMQGKDKEAAEAYYQAAVLLEKAGHSDDAVRLQRIVSRLDEELGVKLEQALKVEPHSSDQ